MVLNSSLKQTNHKASLTYCVKVSVPDVFHVINIPEPETSSRRFSDTSNFQDMHLVLLYRLG